MEQPKEAFVADNNEEDDDPQNSSNSNKVDDEDKQLKTEKKITKRKRQTQVDSLERKRQREERRRNHLNEAFESLENLVLRIDPSVRATQEAPNRQRRLPNATTAGETFVGTNEMLNTALPNRPTLVRHAAELVQQLFDENQGYRQRLMPQLQEAEREAEKIIARENQRRRNQEPIVTDTPSTENGSGVAVPSATAVSQHQYQLPLTIPSGLMVQDPLLLQLQTNTLVNPAGQTPSLSLHQQHPSTALGAVRDQQLLAARALQQQMMLQQMMLPTLLLQQQQQQQALDLGAAASAFLTANQVGASLGSGGAAVPSMDLATLLANISSASDAPNPSGDSTLSDMTLPSTKHP